MVFARKGILDRGTDMALRRGIAGYVNGTSNVLHYADGTDSVPAPTFVPPALGNAAQQRPGLPGAPIAITPPPPTTPAAPPAAALWSQPTAPTAFGQILHGEFGAAQQNPQASPLQSTVAQSLEQAQATNRASALGTPPSPFEWAKNLFIGNPQTTADLHNRQDIAEKLGDPLVQQHLATNPDHLIAAEQDPRGFANITQDPDFRQAMQDAVKNHATMSQPVPVGDGVGNTRPVQVGDPAKAAKVMGDHGVPADAAVALTHGHQLSREEFINSLINTPTKVIQMLFGAQLGHVPTVHDAVAKTYFDAMGQSLAKEQAAIAEMEQRGDKREAAEIKKRKAALAENQQLYSTQMGAYVGGYQRQYPMGLPPP